MTTNINSSRMTKEVEEIGQMNFSGNVIPHFWFQNIRYDSGKPNLNAIVILSEIIYWYRPTEVIDEVSGKITGYQKKFKSDLLQKTYSSLADKFGLSKRQVTEACHFLRDMGLIDLIFRTQKIGEYVVSNILFIKILPDKIRQITFQPPQDLGIDVTGLASECDTPRSLSEEIPHLNVTPLPIEREYTKNTSEITQKITDQIKDPYKSPSATAAPPNPEPLLSSLRESENTFEEAMLGELEATLPLLFSQPGVMVYSTSPEKVAKKPKAKKAAKKAEGYVAGFEDVFWPVVVHKTNKQGALAKWAKTEGIDPQVVKDAYLGQLNAHLKLGKDAQYFRRPETWLNQRGWEDEMLDPNAAATLSLAAQQAPQNLDPWTMLPIPLRRAYMPLDRLSGVTEEDFNRNQREQQVIWFAENGFPELSQKLALKSP